MRLGSLCTGIGGLDLAVQSVFGAETAWISEIDRHASVVLATRFPGVPNVGDLTTVDWCATEPVDILAAGFPCQPFSYAGKRLGEADDRYLWPHIADAVRVLRPRLVVLENVAGHLGCGFDTVLADLASIGFDAEWCVVRASDVGACHRRARLFVVAADAMLGAGGQPDRRTPHPSDLGRERGGQPRGRRGRPADGSVEVVSDADGGRRQGQPKHDGESDKREPSRRRHADRRCDAAPDPDDWGRDEAIMDHDRSDRGRRWGPYDTAIRRHELVLGRGVPDPVDDRGRLNPRLVEWMMMFPEGWVTSLVPRGPSLRLLGNAVVPVQAACALSLLLPQGLGRLATREGGIPCSSSAT